MPTFVRREPTPNPMAFKFVADARLVGDGSLSFTTSEEAAAVPLAAKLFENEDVLSVYLKEDFVAVTAPEWADWETIEKTVTEQLASYEPVAEGNDAQRGPAPSAATAEDAELLEKVSEIIDLHVRPALAQDGGGIDVMGMEDKVLTVRYNGACGGCPSATAGTLNAIENLLQSQVDEGIRLQPY